MAHDHLAEMLDLDAEVLHDHHHEVISWAASLVPENPLVVDLGAGSGTGTLALARAIPGATVVAVDRDEEMLAHLRQRAGDEPRIRTVAADLDRPWPDLGPADLVWASASMHHLADPAAAMARIRDVLRPGGVVVITELDSFPRFLTDPAGAALEERVHAAQADRRHEAGLHMHEDWAALLAAAGFRVLDRRRIDVDLRPPLPPAAGRYAQVSLSRVRQGLADRLSPDDLAALDAIVPGLTERDDLRVRATRTVVAGRR